MLNYSYPSASLALSRGCSLSLNTGGSEDDLPKMPDDFPKMTDDLPKMTTDCPEVRTDDASSVWGGGLGDDVSLSVGMEIYFM